MRMHAYYVVNSSNSFYYFLGLILKDDLNASEGEFVVHPLVFHFHISFKLISRQLLALEQRRVVSETIDATSQ